MPPLVGEHAAQRRLHARVRARAVQMHDEVTIHSALEHLRECQHLEQRRRSTDGGGVARLIRVRRRTRTAADGDDRLRPQLRVQHLFGAVRRETQDELRVAHVLHETSEHQAAVQLRGAIEVQERELTLGYLEYAHDPPSSSILK